MIVIGDRGTGEGSAYPVSKPFPVQELLESGVLWAINRYLFHPRGFALAILAESDLAESCQLELWGDGTEPWQFSAEVDDEKMVVFEGTLTRLKEAWADQGVSE